MMSDKKDDIQKSDALDTLMGFNVINPEWVNKDGNHYAIDVDRYVHKETGEELTQEDAKKRGLRKKWIIDKGGVKRQVWVKYK